MNRVTAVALIALATAGSRHAGAQRGGGEWVTAGGDAQRSSWIRTDAKVSKETFAKPGFQFLWKVKLNNDARQMNALSAPVVMDRYIGYRGFRAFGFVGGSADKIFTLDTDLARMEWQKQFSTMPPPSGTLPCPGGMTANLARASTLPIQPPPAARGGGGRGGAKSGVGEPGRGAITLPQGPPPAPAAGRGRGAPPAQPTGFGRTGTVVYALSADGLFHSMYVSNGDEPHPAVRFLPPNANAHGLIVVDGVAYVATSGNCGSVPNGVWALDFATSQVTSWKTKGGSVAGTAGPALGPDGTLYVTTSDGELVSLEAKTLAVKETYNVGQGFTSSPVLFDHQGKILLAATAKDGKLHVLDTAKLTGTPLASSPAYTRTLDFLPGAVASWQSADGVRWLLSSTAGPVNGFAATNGAVTNGGIVAWKLTDQNGVPTLQAGWASRDMTSPLPPLAMNGVVFGVSSGAFRSGDASLTAAQRAQRSGKAALYALDGATGKELWSSGTTITSFATGGISAGGSQVYVTTHDGTLYAFGMPIEH